ncbi:hypothetical protein JIX59_10445 [Brevundimonas diminuta]|uniref:nSTAND3 domain-containing NTPase n=1 Tax=Brevundimonas diminuta TaxID=293 RepID=UPI001908D87A|nr:hypothetical protein [Brevundimonas diminuta]MBK1969757.1 hypothetical protein [Brevundimonas diminuta]MDA0743214.1 hypothetical protein [Pseudomonadota bacterium]MDA1321213.1 hypothetical protein [Pseudomonadota bacterium]
MDDNTTSAPAGLAGYDYQVDVSIYLALDLMLARKRLSAITLEPANHEDLAADLEDETLVSAATKITTPGYSLIVQAKLRNGEPWADTDLKTLLTKGKKRKSPQTLLTEDKTLRYLLITSAATKGVARDLRMASVGGTWPAALPAGLGSELPGLNGRVAVLDGLDEKKLDGEIRDLLQTTCKVPLPRIPDCIKELRRIALEHMRNGPSVWTREALEKTITTFGGYLATAPEVGMFVKPTNWSDLQTKLAKQHGLIISGSSGTGKTTAAEVLLDELRSAPNGAFEVVRVTGGPEQVSNYKAPGRVVFMIEDPWGKYRYHPEQGAWNHDLESLLNGAHADRQFIVTTRSDVLRESKGQLAGRWFAPLETRHYGQRERFRLFDNQIRLLPEDMKAPVDTHRAVVLKRLESPFEIQKFFDGLRDDRLPDETMSTFVHRCLDHAHVDAIENTIVRQVEDRHDTVPAIAVWGLLKALPRLSWDIVPRLADGIGEEDLELEDKIVPLIRFMAAGRNLRQPNEVLSYYHPRVEAGLERIIKDNAARAARLLGLIVDVLIAIDGEDGADWGREAAARLVQGARNDRVRMKISATAQTALDAYLRARLLTASDTLEADLKLAADIGSGNDTIKLFASWFGARGKTFGSLQNWRETPVSAADATRMAADPDVRHVAGRVIRETLPRTNDHFPDDFADRIAVVAGVQTNAFRDAALRMVGFGYDFNASVVGAGALADFAGFEAVVDAAIDVSVRMRGDDDGSVLLEIRNGEHSEGYADHLAEMHHDDGDTADNFLRLYVAELRRRSGWKAIVARSQSGELIWAWIQVLGGDGITPQAGEMVGLADAARGHPHDASFWNLARKKWSSDLGSRLDDYLKTPGLAEDTRHAVLKTMIVNEPAKGRAWIAAMAAAGDLQGVLRAMTDLRTLAEGYDLKTEIPEFAATAPDHAGAYASLARAVLDGAAYALSPTEIDQLEALDAAASPDLQLARTRLLAAAGRPVRTYVENLLATTENEREDILRATAALGIAIAQGLTDIVNDALKHRFADVRRDALRAVTADLIAPLPAHILAMAHDKGSGVRTALVEILKAKPDAAHQPTLIGLTEDTWTRAEIYYGEEASYPIATSAADLLGEQAPLFADAIETVMNRAAVTADSDLRDALLLAVAKLGDDVGRDRLADLALEIGRPALHAAAAEALFIAGDRSPTRAARFEPHVLGGRAPEVVIGMALAMGATGDKTAVLEAARALYMNPDRSALVVPLLFGAIYGEDGLVDAIAALLPDAMRDALMQAFNGDVLATRPLLDALGDFRIRGAVIHRLRKFFEPKPKESMPVFAMRQ